MSTASGNSEIIRIFDTTLRDGGQSPRAAMKASVSVRLEENGRTVTALAADTGTLPAAANAYVNALNRLLVKREKQVPEAFAVAR